MKPTPQIYLEHVSPLERELLNLVRETEFELILRGAVSLAAATGGKMCIGDRTPLAQDAFSAILFRQGALG